VAPSAARGHLCSDVRRSAEEARFGILRGHWRLQADREHPGEDVPDRHVFTQRWPAGPSSQRRDQIICYTYEADRARRALRGIYEPVAKAEKLDRT